MPTTRASSAAREARALPESVHVIRGIGKPTTPNEAAIIAEQDKFQFQW